MVNTCNDLFKTQINPFDAVAATFENIPSFLCESFSRNYLSTYEKGISAELIACKILKSKGYEIIDKRVRTEYGEIDILAKKNEDIVAIEVKQRKTLDSAKDCISFKQKQRISNAMLLIISQRNKMFENYRIDMICLDTVGRFEHIENAFYIEEYSNF